MDPRKTSPELYTLVHLRKCGLGGEPLHDLVAGSPYDVLVLYEALCTLERDGMIRLARNDTGWAQDRKTATLRDLEVRVRALGPAIEAPEINERERSWTSRNADLFRSLQRGEPDYFYTNARLTLRGHRYIAELESRNNSGKWSWSGEIAEAAASKIGSALGKLARKLGC